MQCKKALLPRICYSIKTVWNLIVCLSSAGKGWPTLYIQWEHHGADDHRSHHSRLRHNHYRFLLGSPWWCSWKYKVRNVCICTYLCRCPCSQQGNRQNAVDSAALILQCKVSWEFWVSAYSLHISRLLESSLLVLLLCRMSPRRVGCCHWSILWNWI